MTCLQIQLAVIVCVFRHVRTVQIYNCTNNKVEIFEDAPVPVTCGGIVSDIDVTWQRGGVLIAACNAGGACTNDFYNDYSLSRSLLTTESQLTLLPEYRRHAGVTVSCTDAFSTASCTLVIRRHPVLSACDVTTDKGSGSVSGSCRVQGAYSSDNDYSCSWTGNNQQSFGAFDSARETCSFTRPLPQDSGLYTYTIAVFPPPTAGFSKTVTITVPATTPFFSRVEGESTTTTLQSTASPTSSPSSTAAIVGTVVPLMVLIIAVTTTVVLWRKRKVLRETGRDVQVTPSADAAVSYTEGNVREINLVTNSRQPQMSNEENPQSAVYENAERPPGKTYDSSCPPYEEHRYSGMQIRTTGSANTAAGKGKTYDSSCPPYEEHRYSGMQIRTTGSANTAAGKDVPESEGKDETIYDIII